MVQGQQGGLSTPIRAIACVVVAPRGTMPEPRSTRLCAAEPSPRRRSLADFTFSRVCRPGFWAGPDKGFGQSSKLKACYRVGQPVMGADLGRLRLVSSQSVTQILFQSFALSPVHGDWPGRAMGEKVKTFLMGNTCLSICAVTASASRNEPSYFTHRAFRQNRIERGHQRT